jgi:toxin secretion/phage lysis holin
VNQQSIWKWTSIGIIAATGAWAKVPYLIQILLLMMGLDIISGLIAAISTRSLNSSIMAKGLFKKLAIFPLLALLHLIEKPLNLPFEFESVAAMAYMVYESLSIIENCARAGVPIPAVIVSALAKAKVKTATQEEIAREFDGTETTAMSVTKSSEIVKTPASEPDLKVEKKVTVLEETHVTPVKPEDKPNS